ncbi:unnamed protein product [Diabrotica balteata]|uniref:Death domain-containing protein n=1 Tax=Diabrotica balteata TaxID=107213 RepID=A0A9N9SNB5_DIABA|nr:unnamed protein product [Diabrotica balteata]
MSSSEEKHQDDITTDALPNPRHGPKDKKIEEEITYTVDLEDDNPEYQEVRKNNFTSFNTRTKRNNGGKKFSPSTASATVINISHSKDIHVGNKNTYNFSGNEKNKKTDIPETSAIRSLKASTQSLSRDDLQFAATHMDSEWKDVARACDIGEGQISQFIADHQVYGIKEVIYQVLLDWFQNDPKSGTVGTLCTILWDNNQKDVVLRWTRRRD